MTTQLKAYFKQKNIFLALITLLAIAAVLAPIWPEGEIEFRIGGLLIWTAVIELIHGFRRADFQERRSAWFNAVATLVFGILLLNASIFIGTAVVVFVGAIFFVDGFRHGTTAYLAYRKGEKAGNEILACIGSLVAAGLILFTNEFGYEWTLALAATWRIIQTGYGIFDAKEGRNQDISEDLLAEYQLSDSTLFREDLETIKTQETNRVQADHGWILTFVVVLFLIHLGRMGTDRSMTGLLSPFVATLGDMFIALAITYAIILPFRIIFRKLTKSTSKKLWNYADQTPTTKRTLFSWWTPTHFYLTSRLRASFRFRKAGYSFRSASLTGLKTGLPFAAMLVAIVPIMGMNWFFDTENWMSGVWNRWAATRTDAWREAIVEASGEPAGPDQFRLSPEGVPATGDFSFVVVGDPGEGDASQLVLKDQILKIAAKPDSKFVVISSDVVYPAGEMKHYEDKFWMPMKGINKPVYAIPGNHDWFDALEAFSAVFFDAGTAQKTMEARVAVDHNLTTSTSESIAGLITEAERQRNEYQVPTGLQKAPYFQIQTDEFAFITIETGILRQIDEAQMAWLKTALAEAEGKYIMALIGHPFYAGGKYWGGYNPMVEELHQILKDAGANIVMGGDTHDLEYYREEEANNQVIHHIVNGGGGAYLSIGTALWPKNEMPTEKWAYYPATEPLVAKIEANNNIIKDPLWFWVEEFEGWPFTPEFLAGIFDYNNSPFFQSFVEVKVEPSQNRVRVIPYGVNGQLKWGDLDTSENLIPEGQTAETPIEWIFPMQVQ